MDRFRFQLINGAGAPSAHTHIDAMDAINAEVELRRRLNGMGFSDSNIMDVMPLHGPAGMDGQFY